MTQSTFDRWMNNSKRDKSDALHILKYHIDWDYEDFHTYQEVMKIQEIKLKRSQGRIDRLVEKFPEYLV